MSVVRVKRDVAVVVLDVPGEGPMVLAPGLAFDSSDPVVRLHPDYFTTDAESESPKRVTTVGLVEEATANPGQKRNR